MKPSTLRRLLATVLCATLCMFAYSSTRSDTRCSAWSHRSAHVGRKEMDAAKQFEAATTVPMPALVHAAVGRSGLSLPGVIMIEPDAADSVYLRAHEAAHQEQMRADGIGLFVLRYGYDFVRGLVAGCSADVAYESIGYEQRADAAGRIVAMQRRRHDA